MDSHTHVPWKELSLVRLTVLTQMLSVVENAMFYPWFLLKTREQVDRLPGQSVSLRVSWNIFLDTWRKAGLQGVYRGYWAASVGYTPAYIAHLGVYAWAKDRLDFGGGRRVYDSTALDWHNTRVALTAGMAAEVSCLMLYVPVDVVCARLQCQAPTDNGMYIGYQNARHAAAQIAKHEGVAGFYRGLGATATFAVASSAIWWGSYESSKQAFNFALCRLRAKNGRPHTESKIPQLCGGFVAGIMATLVSNPVDLVKTRLQTQHVTISGMVPDTSFAGASPSLSAGAGTTPVASTAVPSKPPQTRYHNLMHGLRTVVAEEGVRGLFKGVAPKVMSRAPVSAVSALFIELIFKHSRIPSSHGGPS